MRNLNRGATWSESDNKTGGQDDPVEIDSESSIRDDQIAEKMEYDEMSNSVIEDEEMSEEVV